MAEFVPCGSVEFWISSQVLDCERDYMCSTCRHVFTVQADFNQFYSFVNPTSCPNPERCNSGSFMCLSGGSVPATCKDYQEIKIQEKVEKPVLTVVPHGLKNLLRVVLLHHRSRSCQWGVFLVPWWWF